MRFHLISVTMAKINTGNIYRLDIEIEVDRGRYIMGYYSAL